MSKSLANTIYNTSFRDEFAHIIDYMAAAFHGEEESKIRDVMRVIFSAMTTHAELHQYVMIAEYAAVDERVELDEVIRGNDDDNNKKRLLAYANVSVFRPKKRHGLNVVDQGKYWETIRRQVASLITEHLPKLMPNGLPELLEDDEAQVDAPPAFNGLKIETVGAFPFEKRLTPRNLRYDEQEQGNRWYNVVAGAIVAHYHTFLEIKQGEYYRRTLKQLTADIKQDPNHPVLEDTEAWLVETFKAASAITD